MPDFPVRIPPVTPDEMTQEQRDRLGPWADLVFSQVLMRNPRMYDSFLPHLTTLVANTTLPQRDRQIICMYMLELCGDVYEKTHHVMISRKVGLQEREIEDILAGGGDSLTDDDRVVIRAIEELHRDQNITDATWAKLAARYSQHELMEFVFLNGCYHTMAMLTKTFGMQLEPDLEKFNQSRSYTEKA